MKTIWTSGLKTEDQRKDIERAFQASGLLRERLALICKDKVASNISMRTSSSDYESPNWALKQADSVGYARAYNEIISIITEKK